MPNEPVDNLDQQDLVISRIVNAPRATLWKAWTDPNLLIEGWNTCIDQLEAFARR